MILSFGEKKRVVTVRIKCVLILVCTDYNYVFRHYCKKGRRVPKGGGFAPPYKTFENSVDI